MKKVLKMLSAVLSAVMLFTVIFSVPVAAVTDAQSVNSKRLAYFNEFAVDLLSGTIPDSVPENVIEDIKAAQENADMVLSNAGSTQEQTDSACAELEDALLAFDHNVYYFDLPPYAIAKGAFDAVTSYFDTLDCNADYIINIPLDYEYAQHVILPAYFGVQIPQLLDLNIGGYNFKANTNYYPSDLGYIVYNYMTGDTYTLEYAFENNVISVKSFYNYYTLNKDTESLHFTMSPLNSEPVIEPVIDKSELGSAIMQFHPVGGDYVTPDSYERHFEALENATAVFNNPSATQEEVDLAIEMLNDPQNYLVSADYDTAELERLYYLCEELNTTYKDYLTDESKEILNTALFDFHIYVCEYKCSQAEVDEMTAELKDAVNKVEFNDLPYARERALSFVQAYNDNISEQYPGCGYKLGEFSDYKYGQYLLIQAEDLIPPPMKLSTRIDGYLIESDKADMGFLAVNYITGEVISLERAFYLDLIDIDDFYSFYQSHHYESDDMKFVMCVIGDCDYDSELTVKDATLIQKSIVGLASIDTLKVTVLERDNQADVNHDGEVDVTDATKIQKMIVGLE